MASTAVTRFQQSKRQARLRKQQVDPKRPATTEEEEVAIYRAKMIAANINNQAQLDTLLENLPDLDQRKKCLAMIEPHLSFKSIEVVN